MSTLSFNVVWRDGGAERGLRNLGRHADQTHAKFRQFNKGFAGVGVGLAKFGAAGAVAIGGVAAAAGVLATKAVSSAGKFDASMRLIGATTHETGKGMQGLTKLALEMGAKTSFSAQGASDAMLALARGGMTAAQMKAGALKATLTLASAGGLELGNAANYMVQGLSGFGLKAKDASQVAAALAGAANASTSSVEDMGLALSQVGSGAKTAGLSIQDTTAALAAFSNAGVKGSDAGTSLKTFLQRLVPVTKHARTAMSELGLITKDGSNQFFDASGKIKSMAEVSQVLQDALKGQTREQKIATLTTVFGSDASRAAAILADEGAKGITKYTKATSDKSAAENLAKTATQGYAGALERFKGSVETAGIQVGTKLLPAATKLLNFLSGPGIEALSSFGGSVSHIAGPVFTAFMSGLTGGKGSFKDFADYLRTHQADFVGGFVSFGKGAIGFGITLAQVLSAGLRGFATLSDGIDDFVVGQIDNLGTFLNAGVLAFGWLPGMGGKLIAAQIGFARLTATVHTNMHKTGESARGFADKLDNGLIPALQRAGGKMDEVGRKEIINAQQRDNAAKAALLIKAIGTAADGSQIHLKSWADRAHLASDVQRGLQGRIRDAKKAMNDQVEAAQRAEVGQKALTKAWKTGRDRLYDEFRQMGISKKEARKLADAYAGVPPKVRTPFTTPGSDTSIHNAKELRRRIKELRNKGVHISFSSNAAEVAKAYNISLVNRGRGAGGPNRGGHDRRGGVTSSAAGGLIRGPGTGTSDSILGMELGGTPTSWVSNGEYVVNARQTRKNLDVLEAINGGQDLPRRAGGGVVVNYGRFPGSSAPRTFDVQGDRLAMNLGDRIGARLGSWLAGKAAAAQGGGAFGGAGIAGAGHLARAALSQVGSAAWGVGQCLKFVRSMAGAPGGTYDASAAWRNARYKHRGDHNVPSSVPVYWGGGHGHIAASIGGGRIVTTDFPRTGRIGVTTISRLQSAWGKPYLGWANDVNGRVTSRYGLSSGGVVGVGVGEHGPERVLSAAQTRTFDRMVRVMDSRGAGNTYMVNISAPNYIGSRQELRKTMVDMVRSGAFEVVKR